MTATQTIDTIVSDPNIRNGRLVVAGTSIELITIITGYLYRDQTADDLAVNYELPLWQVYAALAYYYQNQTEVDRLIAEDYRTATALLAQLEAEGKATHFE